MNPAAGLALCAGPRSNEKLVANPKTGLFANIPRRTGPTILRVVVSADLSLMPGESAGCLLPIVGEVIQLSGIFAQDHARDFVDSRNRDFAVMKQVGERGSQSQPRGLRGLPADLLPVVRAASGI